MSAATYRNQWQEYRIVSQTGTYKATGTASASTGYAGVIVTYKAATTPADTTPPSTPTNLAVNAATPTSATVSWTAATDNVGVTGYDLYLNGAAHGTTTVTTANFTGLTCNTSYTVGVDAFDAAGNKSLIATTNITTAACDTTPPSVPANLQATTTLTSATLTWTAATDDTAVAGYGLYRNGQSVGSTTSTVSTFSNLTCGTTYTLGVDAYDASGNRSAQATLGVTTSACDTTAPTVSITAPADQATISGTQTVSATATDDTAVAGVQFKLDGTNLGNEVTSAPYNLTWTTSQVPNGIHTLTAVARDASGNTATSPTVTVTVSNTFTGPTVNAMPVLTHGLPAFGEGNVIYSPSFGNDNNYGSGSGAYLCGPPCSLVIDISSLPLAQRQQVLAAWYNDSNLFYAGAINASYYNEPKDYTIDVSYAPGGTGTTPSSWTTLTTVNGNFYNGRQHLLNLNGANWIRMRVSAVNGSSGNMDASFNFDLHDASNGANDSWLILGDSITEDDMGHYEPTNFMQQVNAAHPTYFPSEVNGGIGGWTADSALQTDTRTGQLYIDEFLAASAAHFVSLDYGTNEAIQGGSQLASYRTNMTTLINKVIAAGKVPVLRRSIPWGCHTGIQNNGPTVNAVLQDLIAQYPQAVVGPDAWSYFQAHPSYISSDCIHPTIGTGNAAYRQLYVNALLAGVYSSAP